MSSPSLPMVPQLLEMALGVKGALGILLCLYVVIREHVTSPFSALPAQRIRPTNETMSYDRASATVTWRVPCVNTHTVTTNNKVLYTSLLVG